VLDDGELAGGAPSGALASEEVHGKD
jgi:hypothetical protein